jgi:hypothetical protein
LQKIGIKTFLFSHHTQNSMSDFQNLFSVSIIADPKPKGAKQRSSISVKNRLRARAVDRREVFHKCSFHSLESCVVSSSLSCLAEAATNDNSNSSGGGSSAQQQPTPNHPPPLIPSPPLAECRMWAWVVLCSSQSSSSESQSSQPSSTAASAQTNSLPFTFFLRHYRPNKSV